MSGMRLFLAVMAMVAAITPSTQAFQLSLLLSSGHAELSVGQGELNESSRIEIRGVSTSTTMETIVIQLDDKQGAAYWNRINQERQVLPGAFSFELPVGGLSTPSGRPVLPGNLERIIVFPGEKGSGIEQVSIQVLQAEALPNGALGWDFGPHRAAVFPGFEMITPDDARVTGHKLSAIKRPSGDALMTDGIRGIERFEAALANGHYKVTLWTEDLGEWQTLPYWTKRRIRLNSTVVDDEHLSAEDWVRNVYLAGGAREALVDGDAWALHGSRRGGVVQAEVIVKHGVLSVALDGDLPPARYLAGLLVEPLLDGQASVFESVMAQRERLYREKWVEAAPATEAWLPTPGDLGGSYNQTNPETPEDTVLARGDSTFHELWLDVPPEVETAALEVQYEDGWLENLDLSLWYGLWQFERVTPGGTALEINPSRLVPVFDAVPSAAPLRRKLYLRLTSGETTRPGVYDATLVVRLNEKSVRIPISVTVLDVVLPQTDKAIGTYLEEAPHRGWFGDLAAGRQEAVNCDLRLLRDFGMTGMSPPFTAPRRWFVERHVSVMEKLNALGFGPRAMAYASVKWSMKEDGLSGMLENVRATNTLLQEYGYGDVVWSIVDEARNDGPDYGDEKALIHAFRQAAPKAILAGHVNHPEDRELASLLDVALINAGYSVSGRSIASLAAAGVESWLYNMENPRLAAGAYLWRSGAKGYLQWHARMPTADPFDPTDGREGDFQFLYPSYAACDDAEVHSDLVDLSEGIQDLRWIHWLEQASELDRSAQRLLLELRNITPDPWIDARKMTGTEIEQMRARIKTFARNRWMYR